MKIPLVMGKCLPIDIKTRQPLKEIPSEEVECAPPAAILNQCMEHVDTIAQVLVMTADTDGNLAFFTNCDGLAEAMLFIEMIKTQALLTRVGSAAEDTQA